MHILISLIFDVALIASFKYFRVIRYFSSPLQLSSHLYVAIYGFQFTMDNFASFRARATFRSSLTAL